MADLVLPRGELKVLKAEDKDYERGLLVKLLDNGGYKMAYWYDKPNKPYPVEIIVDGESIKKDGKIVEMKFHPKDYYDKQEENTKVNKKEVSKIYKFLLSFGINANKTKDILKKNLQLVNKKFRGDTPRDKAMALYGMHLIGEVLNRRKK